VVIESKEYGFSVSRAIPQILAYMMGNPYPENSTFGMITNGEEYIFLKLLRGEINQYALSDLFSIRNSRNNGLNEAMRVLKELVIAILNDYTRYQALPGNAYPEALPPLS
jgi:hypothetical protein